MSKDNEQSTIEEADLGTKNKIFQYFKTIQTKVKSNVCHKQLVIDFREKHFQKTQRYSKELVLKKIRLLEQYNNNSQKITHIYKEPHLIPGGNYLFLGKIYSSLRHNQNLMFKLLTYATNNNEKSKLGTFIYNTLNTNLFSSNSLEDEYTLMLIRTLWNEINALNENSTYEDFLNEESQSKYLLQNLYKKDDIRNFFIQILKSTVSELESIDDTISFQLKELIAEVKRDQEEKKKPPPQFQLAFQRDRAPSTVSRMSVMSDINPMMKSSHSKKNDGVVMSKVKNRTFKSIDTETFFAQYVADLSKRKLNEFKLKYDNDFTKEYIDYHIDLIEKNENNSDNNNNSNDNKNTILDKLKRNPFANGPFFRTIFEEEDSEELFYIFQEFFGMSIKYLDRIIYKINKNYDIVPSSIKQICKIIEKLLKKKFPNISKVKLYGFISRFLIDILLEQIFIRPERSDLLDSALLTPQTKQNLIILSQILKQFFSCTFFKQDTNKGLTIFNSYFISKIEIIDSFYTKTLENVEMPSFILNIINDSKEIDLNTFNYNFFKENPNEHVREIVILFDDETSLLIVDLAKKHKDELENLSHETNAPLLNTFLASLSRIIKPAQYKTLEKEGTAVSKAQKNSQPIERVFYSVIKLEYSDIMQKIMELYEGPYLIPLIKNKKRELTEDEQNANIIARFKNNLCKILYDCVPLNKEFTSKSTMEMISYFKNISSIPYFSFDNSINMDWNITYLEETSMNLPGKYNENNNEAIYIELMNELDIEMDNLIEYSKVISVLHEKMRYVEKYKEEINRLWNNIQEEKVKEAVKTFITKDDTYTFKFENKDNIGLNIKIEPRSKTEGKTILNFCDDFPNLIQAIKTGSANNQVDNMRGGGDDENKTKIDYFNYLFDIGVVDQLNKYFMYIEKAVTEKYFIYGFDKLFDRTKPTLSDYEIQHYSKDKCEKILKDKLEQDDKEVREYFKEKIGFDKKRSKKDQETYVISDKYMIEKIIDLIKEYVMFRLYPMLCPDESSISDDDYKEKFDYLSQKCRPSSLSDHLPDETIVIASLSRAKKYMRMFETAKTPNGKYTGFKKVKDLIAKNVNFNRIKGDEEIIAKDDEMPLLLYFLIMAAPARYDTNGKYLGLFGKLFGIPSDKDISDLETPARLLDHITLLAFENVATQKEFDEKLLEVMKGGNT